MSSQHPPYPPQPPYGNQVPQGFPDPNPNPPWYGYGSPPPPQHQGQQYPGGPPPSSQSPQPPSGQYQYSQAAGPQYQGHPPPPPGQQPPYGQQYPQPYSQPPGYPQPGYPQQQYGGSSQQQQQQQQQQHQPSYPQAQPPAQHPYYSAPIHVYSTPASPGYDLSQRSSLPRIDTSTDIEVLRKAMKGMGCDERALIRVFASPKYQHPFALQQLRDDYDARFVRDLNEDIKGETKGEFEDVLLALLRGPLAHDVFTLVKALDRAGTDEEALMDVLLCRSNADVSAIVAEFRHVTGRNLIDVIKDDVDANLFRLYSMVLSATRAEDAAPIVPADIEAKVTELQCATEGTVGANTIAVAQILTSANAAQLRAMSDAYQHKYHRSLQDVIEREFRGDMEDALLRILTSAAGDGGKVDVDWLRAPLMKTMKKHGLFIYRALRLYWGDKARLQAAQMAHQRYYHKMLGTQLKESLSGDYEELMIALIGEK
ncbi:Calpactin I heavy chain, calcium ion binding [Trichoderma parareesei]|uniref:Calpactin I heavy chain, calcium ion binding n=1 Tax=Trichoderma parareesei TaxID=858221 RepID=A0A2H2ZMC8_TRIPA|nr:Calpactin I heavy chain, calcium ion binding [Trichoderma parareesei]